MASSESQSTLTNQHTNDGLSVIQEPKEIHIDGTKLDEEEFTTINRDELQKEFAKLQETGENAVANRTFYGKALNFGFKVQFENTRNMVYMLGIFASFAGILSGLDQSIISGAQIKIPDSIFVHGRRLNEHEISLISSLMPLGAMAGSLVMVPLNHFFGRRGSLIISCIWYTIGSALCAGTHTRNMLYAGRFILGVGVGIEGGCVGIYISESVPADLRGGLVSMYQMTIALGEVFGFAVAAIFFDVKGGWRYMVGSSLVFSTILMIGLLFLPESPRWLMSKGHEGESWLVWKQLRNIADPTAQMEFLAMRQAIQREIESQKEESVLTRYVELFARGRSRRALIYAFIMVFFGQMTGINGIMYNMSGIMKETGFDDKHAVLMSMVGGSALFLGTIPAVLYMDKFGRRVWAQNIVGFFVGLVLVGVGSRFNGITERPRALGLSLTGIILYMGFFGAYATLTWVLPAESFDLRTRSQGMAICSATLYLFSFIITYNFTKMSEEMTYIGFMTGFFGGLAVLGFIYQLFFMPETKDRTLEEIDDIFSTPTRAIVKDNMDRLKHRLRHFSEKKEPLVRE